MSGFHYKNHVRITSESGVRLPLGSYVCKCDQKEKTLITYGNYVRIMLQKSRQNYVMKLRKIYTRKLINKTMQMKTKKM